MNSSVSLLSWKNKRPPSREPLYCYCRSQSSGVGQDELRKSRLSQQRNPVKRRFDNSSADLIYIGNPPVLINHCLFAIGQAHHRRYNNLLAIQRQR